MKGIRKFSRLLFLFPFLVCACAPAVRNPVSIQSVQGLAPESVSEYRIHPGDQLEVKFFYNPELNETVIVRPDGRISLQLANEIMAAGLTPAALTDILVKKYAVEIDRPAVTVIVRSFSMQRVFVDGEVGKPGLIPLTNLMTVLQAIAQAGGLKETARTDEIVIMRQGPGKKVLPIVVNLEKALDGTDSRQDITLAANDIVYAPRSHIANADLWVDQYIRRLLPIVPGFAVTP